LPQRHLLMSQDFDSCCSCDAVLSNDQINCYLCFLTLYILAVSTAWSLNSARQRFTLSKTFSLLGANSDFQSLRKFLIRVETLLFCVRTVFALSIILVKPVSTIWSTMQPVMQPIICCVHRGNTLDAVMNQMNPVHYIIFYICKINVIIITLDILPFPSSPFPPGFLHFLCAFRFKSTECRKKSLRKMGRNCDRLCATSIIAWRFIVAIVLHFIFLVSDTE
jgi:hypothetical protein